MSVVVLMVFVSLVLVAGSILLFVFSVHQRDYEHADRLALAPLANDVAPRAPSAPRAPRAPLPPSPDRTPINRKDEPSPSPCPPEES